MKKIVKASLCISVLLVAGLAKASAFQSQSHWEIAEKTLALSSLKFDPEQEKIYKSGAFLADIGRLAWDHRYTHSDSMVFAEKLEKIRSEANLEEALFVLGWKHHVIQDTLGSVTKEIFNSGNYILRCSQLENHFKKSGSKMLFGGEESFYINCDLIRKTYKELHGFSPTDEDVFLELNKLIIGVNIISHLPQTKVDLSEDEKQNLDIQVSSLSENCAKDFNHDNLSDIVIDEHTLIKESEIIKPTISGNDALSERLKEFGKVAHFEKIGTYGNFDKVTYKIDNKEKYDSLISETIPLVLSLIK